jgi:RNA polymerase sigma-70 factor (ECF subfamily)
VPLGTVKRRLHTARKRLRLELEGSVADSQEWADGVMGDPDDECDERELVGAGSGSFAW